MICEVIQIVFKHAFVFYIFQTCLKFRSKSFNYFSHIIHVLCEIIPITARPVFKYFSHTELLCHTHFKYIFHKFQTNSLQ